MCNSGEGDYRIGGFITRRYGSRDGVGPTDAIQLETPSREEPDVAMAEGFGRAIVDMHRLYFE